MSQMTVVAPPGPAEVLNGSPLPHLRRLVVTESATEVVISGRVPTYYLKQLAQETVRAAVGKRRLSNQVQVVRS